MFKTLSQAIYVVHEPLRQFLPDLPELMANPDKFLAAREVRVGSVKFYGGLPVVFCVGCLALMVLVVRDDGVDFVALLLAIGLAAGLALSLGHPQQELVLRAGGVEFVFGNTSVW
jgi:hypothetical protein